MSSKQAYNTLVEDCPNPSETIGQDGQDYQNCPWKKRELGVLSDTFRMLLYLPLSTAEDDNRRATKSAGGTSHLCIVAQVLCTGLCLAVRFSINANHVPCLRTLLLSTLFFLPTHFQPSSAFLSLSSLLTLVQKREQTSWLPPPAGVAPLLIHDDN